MSKKGRKKEERDARLALAAAIISLATSVIDLVCKLIE